MFGRSRLQRHTSSAHGRTGAATIVAVAALLVGAFIAIPAFATPIKYYTPTISPTCRDANSSSPDLMLTLTNNMAPGGQGFGSAQITIPSGWTVPTLTASNTSFSFANPATQRSWSASKPNPTTIRLTSATSADLVPPQGSITFTFPATAPASGGPYEFTTAVKQSNNFLGTGNDFTLNKNPKAAQPTISIGQCNASPTAVNDSYSTSEDNALNVIAPGVLGNDTDPEHDTLTAVLGTGPAHGTLTLNSNGSFTYTPAANYNGSDSFTYYANDSHTNSATAATVSLTITPVNDAPAAANDTYTTGAQEDTPFIVSAPGVLLNDTDIDSASLTAVKVTDPSNGSISLSSDGSFTYTPNSNFNGVDSFTYKASDGALFSNVATVTITVAAVNDPPNAVNDSYSAIAGSQLSTAAPGVLGNDTDPENDSLTAVLDSGPSHGSLTLNADGSFSYTADANYSGADSFTYHANDGSANSAPATVNITVWASSLACGDSTTVDDGAGDVITITNLLTGTNCPPAVFSGTFDGGKFTLDKPPLEQVKLKVDVNAWQTEKAVNPIPATIVTPPDGGEDGVWCNGTPTNYSMPDTHSWCLIDQHAELAGQVGGVQQMKVYETWLLEGDATLCRCK